jgi:tRNA (guanine-N7-)-methyltransferase
MVRERAGSTKFYDALILSGTDLPPALDPATLFATVQPVEIDIGCGRGRFLLARALQNPHINFLGIDRVTLRLRKLDRRAVDSGLGNIRLIQGDARTVVGEILAPSTVTTFYVYYPDPWPKRRHQRNRLVCPAFIDGIHRALVETGVIHLCTDHGDYYADICKLWRQEPRFQEVPPYVPSEAEETDFGKLFSGLARSANRCSFMKQPARACLGLDAERAVI